MTWDITFAILCAAGGWLIRDTWKAVRTERDFVRICRHNHHLQMQLLEKHQELQNVRAQLARSTSTQSLAE